MRIINICSWIAWWLTVLGLAGMLLVDRLAYVDASGVVREPWYLAGPGIVLFLSGVAGMVVTKVMMAVARKKYRSNLPQSA